MENVVFPPWHKLCMRPDSGCVHNSLINTISSGHLAKSYNKSEFLSVYTMQFELTLNFDYIYITVRLKRLMFSVESQYTKW